MSSKDRSRPGGLPFCPVNQSTASSHSGPKTSLYLQDDEFFTTRDIPNQCVQGVLNDLTKVSLVHCITSGTGVSTSEVGKYHYANVFPHYVIYGDYHIAPGEKTITEVDFVVDDATTIFYDFDAFGSVINARPFIEQLVQANALNRPIITGPDPQILYFTGKRDIFSADTILGKVGASHSPTPSLGGPRGVRLQNRIFMTLSLKEEVTFDEVIFRTEVLLMYLGILVGRPQNLLSLSLRLGTDSERPVILRVYWSTPPKRDPACEWDRAPHPSDVLLDAVSEPNEFSSVLSKWLDRHQEWRDARWRFYKSFSKQRRYDIDRLIGSANMFDILPGSAVPHDVQLPEHLKAARDAARNMFKDLEISPERNSILSALGRVGKSNLKQKVRHRAQVLLATTGSCFPELALVTDEAVNCRNHYVHGSEPRFDYNQNFQAVTFFTDTLEFIFATSDLIEAG